METPTYDEVRSPPVAMEKFEIEENEYSTIDSPKKKSSEDGATSKYNNVIVAILLVFLLIVALLLFFALAGVVIAFTHEVADLRHAIQLEKSANFSDRLESMQSSADTLFQQLNISFSQLLRDQLEEINEQVDENRRLSDKNYARLEVKIASLNSSFQTLHVELNSSFNQLLQEEIENVIFDTQELRALVSDNHLQVNQTILVMEENSKKMFETVSNQQRESFNALASKLSYLNSTVIENDLRANQTTTSLRLEFASRTDELDQSFNTGLNGLNSSVREVTLAQDRFRVKFENSTATQEQLFTDAIINLQDKIERVGSTFNRTLNEMIDSANNDTLKLKVSLNENYVQLNQSITELEETSVQMFEATSIKHLENFNDVAVRIDSLNSSVKENHIQVNQMVMSLQESSKNGFTSVSADLESLNASAIERYRLANETISSIQQASMKGLEVVSIELERLNSSVKRSDKIFKEEIRALEENFMVNFENFSAELETIYSTINDSIASLNVSVDALFLQHSAEIEELLFDQLEDSLRLNASLSEKYSELRQMIPANREHVEQRLQRDLAELSTNFSAAIFSLNSSVSEHLEQQNFTFNQLVSKEIGMIRFNQLNASQRFDVTLSGLSQTVVALEERTDQQINNVTKNLVQGISDLNSSLDTVGELLELQNVTLNQLVNKEIERISLNQHNASQRFNVLLSGLSQTVVALEEKTDQQINNVTQNLVQGISNLNSSLDTVGELLELQNFTLNQLVNKEIERISLNQHNTSQRFNVLLSGLSQTVVALEKRTDQQIDDVTLTLMQSISSLNSSLNTVGERFEEQNFTLSTEIGKISYNQRNTSRRFDVILSGLSQTIIALENRTDQQIDNVTNDLMQGIYNLNLSLDTVGERLERQNFTFNQLVSREIERIHLNQLNASQRFNATVSGLSQAVVSLEKRTDLRIDNVTQNLMQGISSLNSSLSERFMQTNFTVIELERMLRSVSVELRQQRQNINITASRLTNLSSSFNELSHQLANDRRLEQLNTSFSQLVSRKIQTLQTDVSQKLNASLTENNSKINETILSVIRAAGLFSAYPALSCSSLAPSSPSGYYWVTASNGSAVRVYCDMTQTCGGVTGGWTRVATLNMTDSSQECPNGLRQRNDTGTTNDSIIRSCVKSGDEPGCSSVEYPTASIQYSQVCGKIIGYQIGSPNAFYYPRGNISTTYVDGVSLTYSTPRAHIWTFAATIGEKNVHSSSSCKCIKSNAISPPSFVGSDYFCDTGLHIYNETQPGFLGGDPLWDGQGCESPSTCCSFNTPPWFHKQLPQPTSEDIEMRVCRKQGADNEDIAIESVEIYVQ